MIWIFIIVLGVFNGPLIPSGFGWANRYIEVRSNVQIAPSIAGAIGDVLILSLMGLSYDITGPQSIWSYVLGMTATLTITSWLMYLIGHLHGDRYEEK